MGRRSRRDVPRRLAVIGDTQHYRDDQGRLCALEPVVLQLDLWAAHFEHVVICAPLGEGPPPAGYAPYRSTNLSIEPLRSGGGNTLGAKLGMARLLPAWAWTTRRVARSVDAVHLRCPCNIGLIAIFSTWGAVAHRYALYAGVWRGYDGEPFFFGLQRRLLASRRFGGPVSVYAPPDPARPHLVPFFSPSFSEAYWDAAGPGAARKVEEIAAADPDRPLRTVTVGRLTPNKNQHTVIRALGEVVRRGVDATLDVYGDGPCRDELTRLAADVGIAERVRFHGMVDHARVLEAFADADLHLLATRQEGFGKVLLEGMVHATVPIFSESPLAPEISGDGSRALVFATDDDAALADHVCSLVADPPRWAAMAAAARAYAGTQTLDRFADLVDAMLEERWGVPAGGAPRPQ